ncbi:hypothetical protein MLD38_026248 [Melastoma candidum]|uniref:Uncharacterized protein n=1 Tax=Melastoma candidum TaxID=119954 RepID=A0ACB9NYX1_9MYRT|nr:hypothetical protein MLD38_026248 [Melastoma candidum]
MLGFNWGVASLWACITETRSRGPCDAPPLTIGSPSIYLSYSGSQNWLPNKEIDVIESLISFNIREEKFCLARLPVGRTFPPHDTPPQHTFHPPTPNIIPK